MKNEEEERKDFLEIGFPKLAKSTSAPEIVNLPANKAPKEAWRDT
jgi:hypothetical protein